MKIISRSMDHQITTTTARASRWRAIVAAPMRDRPDLVNDNRKVFVHVLLRASALEPHSPLLNHWIDLNFRHQILSSRTYDEKS